ncbi:LOW QUALITY PROTEIN: hypothetical protein RJ639_021154 [Escallonia herrerae]|uniref:Reverse transcriptase RNase H-like domain-containing protein n=1 Tax=Escallonia herrerae TaxID=1293975 RepID=A0AA89AGU0_9ASTE|nr:LOW QUALITY PROTEIN: hypothetical protein RJ639_021154 [Escallonia herrerae]
MTKTTISSIFGHYTTEEQEENVPKTALRTRRAPLPIALNKGQHKINLAKSSISRPVAKRVNEGQEEGGEGVFGVGEQELLGKTDGRGADRGISGGDGVLEGLRGEVQWLEDDAVGWRNCAAEGGEDAVAGVGLGEGIGEEGGGVAEDLGGGGGGGGGHGGGGRKVLATESAVNAVLVRQQDGQQLPVYYVSKVLQGAEQRYPNAEKLAFTLLTAARKLPQYFQFHTIIVLTDKPLKHILHRPDLFGCLVPWLGEFDIYYRPRPSIKGQALADFIVKRTLPVEVEEEPFFPIQSGLFTWTLHVDGSSNTSGSGAGLILNGLDGLTVDPSFFLTFVVSPHQRPTMLYGKSKKAYADNT